VFWSTNRCFAPSETTLLTLVGGFSPSLPEDLPTPIVFLVEGLFPILFSPATFVKSPRENNPLLFPRGSLLL